MIFNLCLIVKKLIRLSFQCKKKSTTAYYKIYLDTRLCGHVEMLEKLFIDGSVELL